jgi:DNA-3-methyladenine glycosylase
MYRVETSRDNRPLQSHFFARPSTQVAPDLLGARLFYHGRNGIITEVEAYGGADDPASHAYRGETPRSKIMFGPPGFSYVYLIYGMHHCLNIVTGQKGEGSAVLIRGLYVPEEDIHYNGPGKLTKYLGITRADNGVDITASEDFFVLPKSRDVSFQATPRIGIREGVDKLWRFVVEDTDFS